MSTEIISDVTVRMRHVRGAKLCSRGARAWFAAYGLPWQAFLDTGIPAADLEATGDPLALRAVAVARAEHGR